MNIPRSGNHLEDRFDDEQENDNESRVLECGCLSGNCTCDANWDDRD